MVDVSELARLDVSELLYVVLMSEIIVRLGNKFIKWNEALECKDLKFSPGKTKVIVTGGITLDGLSKSKVCCLRIKANSVLCMQCGKSVHGRCAGVKRGPQGIEEI